jgi:hypothetical protein
MTDDLPNFDGLEAVELAIAATPHAVQALRRPLAPRIDAGVQTSRAAWHVRAAELAGAVPQVGNTLAAGSEVWSVKEVTRLSFATRYRLVCELT